jgi:glycosyltransferase involved in cell wall biosynthesis
MNNHNLQYWELFSKLKACVIIPTYNNCGTLGKVVEDVFQYTGNIIVINDGSTDETEKVLNAFSGLDIVRIGENTGKGNAIRAGFKKAIEKGFDYAITIDSDGQHFAEDLPKFLEALEKEPDSLIIGARNMSQEGIPVKSSFGNKFSNFWVWVETGKWLPDTQSGYRLYPVKLLEKMRFFSKKFEFEIEVLARTNWKAINIISVPVRIYYSPKEKRISHFRPFRDSMRISVLNSCLVTKALLFARPFKFVKSLNRKNIKQFVKNNLLNPNESNIRKALAVTLGFFMGIVPIWGYQLILAILLAHLLKLNKAIVIVTANISIPPMIPLILYISFKVGGLIIGEKASHLSFASGMNFETIKINLYQYLIGSICFAVLFSIICGLITFIILQLFRKPKIAIN